MSEKAAVEAHSLGKVYRAHKKGTGALGTVRSLLRGEKTSTVAVENLTFRLETGEMVGFLGPNGAGKTTTLKMLTGILHPSAGEARVLGFVPFERKPAMLREIALVMGNRQQLWWDLPAWESFLVLRELYGIGQSEFRARTDELVAALRLEDKLHTQVRKLSLGERMKCELVAALLHHPRVLFLDEPTLGLDIVSQQRIRAFLRDYNRTTRCTVLLTSHYMQDIQELCDRVIVIDQGTSVYDGRLSELMARFSGHRKLKLTFTGENPAGLDSFGQVTEADDGAILVGIERAQTAQVVAQILDRFPVQDIEIVDVSVEEVVSSLFAAPDP